VHQTVSEDVSTPSESEEWPRFGQIMGRSRTSIGCRTVSASTGLLPDSPLPKQLRGRGQIVDLQVWAGVGVGLG
jgi:hypothetical protein